MVGDLRRRAPYYWSDWKDALDYRVVPATVYMYFAKYDTPHFLEGYVHYHNCHHGTRNIIPYPNTLALPLEHFRQQAEEREQ